MCMYTGLRFKGTVKKCFRRDFKLIADGRWECATDVRLRAFAKVANASFIPCGGLCSMPDSWDEGDKIVNAYDEGSGYWAFQCSLVNYEDTIETFLDLVPYFAESVDYCEVLYEEWAYSNKYELVDNLMKLITAKFVKYGGCGYYVGTLSELPKKYFRYYRYDSRRHERTVGIAYVKSIVDVYAALQEKYDSVDALDWGVEEIKPSTDGLCEIYYGG